MTTDSPVLLPTRLTYRGLTCVQLPEEYLLKSSPKPTQKAPFFPELKLKNYLEDDEERNLYHRLVLQESTSLNPETLFVWLDNAYLFFLSVSSSQRRIKSLMQLIMLEKILLKFQG